MLRPYAVQDAADFLRLSTLASGNDMPLERFLEQDGAWPAQQTRRRVLAEVQGNVVGMAELSHFDYLPPGWLRLILAVDPAHRQQGVGAALHRWAETQAGELQPGGLSGIVLDHDPQSRDWARRRGFEVHAHRFASVLDLGRPHPAPEWPSGVHPRDMSGATPADWERLSGLYGDLLTQTPDLAGQPRWTPEQLLAHTQNNSRSRPEWMLLAVSDAGEWLAFCQGVRISTGIYNEFTGTVAAARGRGLARALKLELIRRAQAAGIKLMRTNNHAANLPMLSVNRRLGFEQLSGAWELWRAQT